MGTTVKMNSDAIAAILKSPAMRADLLARAQRIAAAAGPGMEADSTIGQTRARASVITATYEAMHAEATSRRLSSAIQAGA